MVWGLRFGLYLKTSADLRLLKPVFGTIPYRLLFRFFLSV